MRRPGVTSHPEDLVALCLVEHRRLVRSLDLICGDRARAEELAQEALVRLWQRWPKVRRLDRPGAWLHRVGVNLAISEQRRRAAEARAVTRLARTVTDSAPEADLERSEVRRALARLPDRQRAAVVLRYLLDMSVADVGFALNLSAGATRALTFRAIESLRADLALADELDLDLEESPYAP